MNGYLYTQPYIHVAGGRGCLVRHSCSRLVSSAVGRVSNSAVSVSYKEAAAASIESVKGRNKGNRAGWGRDIACVCVCVCVCVWVHRPHSAGLQEHFSRSSSSSSSSSPTAAYIQALAHSISAISSVYESACIRDGFTIIRHVARAGLIIYDHTYIHVCICLRGYACTGSPSREA